MERIQYQHTHRTLLPSDVAAVEAGPVLDDLEEDLARHVLGRVSLEEPVDAIVKDVAVALAVEPHEAGVALPRRVDQTTLTCRWFTANWAHVTREHVGNRHHRDYRVGVKISGQPCGSLKA